MWKVIEAEEFNGRTAYEIVRLNEEGRETFRMCAMYASLQEAQRIADYWEKRESEGQVLKTQ